MSLLFSTSLLKYNFFAFLTRFKKNILSLVDPNQTWPEWYSYLARVTVCFICLYRIDTCLLTSFIDSLYHTVRALLRSMCWCTLSNDIQIKSANVCVCVLWERERERVCVCVCVCVCVHACVCRPNEFQVCSTLAYLHIFISTFCTMPMYNVWGSKTDGDNIIYIYIEREREWGGGGVCTMGLISG